MDSDNFFGFDTENAPEDTSEGWDDAEYDALNDETFGSAMVDGDWEESHMQMASLTEARRSTRKQQQEYQNSLKRDEEALLGNLKNFTLLQQNGPDSRIGPSSAPVNISGYTSRPGQHHIRSSMLTNHDLPGSPNSIWTPSPDLDKLTPVTAHQSPSNGLNRSIGQPPGLYNIGKLPSMGVNTIKTVAEIEEEMKRQQPFINHINAKRAEYLEHEMAKQSMNRSQHHQGNITGPVQQQTSYTGQGGMPTNNPNNFNVQFQQLHQQRPFLNQGNLQGPVPPQYHLHQQHHQNLLNNNNLKGIGNHHNQAPPNSHMNHQQHYNNAQSGGHENNYGGQFTHNYHNHANHHQSHQQSQQQNHYHSSSRLGSDNNRYLNSNGYDHSRNSGNHYDNRNNYDRRSYDHNRSHDHGRNHYDRSHNRDDYPSHSSGRTRRDSEAEWEEWHRLREEDEYCGLMTPKEKNWLLNIQDMQLRSDNPYQDDYYYVMHSVKQQRKREEEVIFINGLQLLIHDRKDGKEYEPPRLENSLGKLQVVSVNAPRKIIDLQVVHLDPSHPTTPLQRDMRKHRHLLLHVEKLYGTMMELDDLERKIRHLPDCPTRDLYKSKSQQLAKRLWANVTVSPEKFLQLLCIRKGKSLIHRLMMWLGEVEYTRLIMTIVQNMSLLTKKDTHDQHLALFWPMTDRLIAVSHPQPLLELASVFLSQGGSSQKANVTSALYNKYGVSLILALLLRGEHLSSDLESCVVWQELLSAIINALASLPESSLTNKSSSNDIAQALPSVALAASPFPPSNHLNRCVGIDPQLVMKGREKMMLIEGTNPKQATQSPAIS